MGEKVTCPRRMAEFGPWKREEGLDLWTSGHGLIGQDAVGPSCSFCGSLNPDRFMELVRDGWIVEPTDKSYKAYLARPRPDEQPADERSPATAAKFYYQHLSQAQQDEFIALVNSRTMRISYPGYFCALPFFAQVKAQPPA